MAKWVYWGLDENLCVEMEKRYTRSDLRVYPPGDVVDVNLVIHDIMMGLAKPETKWAIWKIDYDGQGNPRVSVMTDVGVLYDIIITDKGDKIRVCVVGSGGFPSWFKRIMEYLWARRSF